MHDAGAMRDDESLEDLVGDASDLRERQVALAIEELLDGLALEALEDHERDVARACGRGRGASR